MYGVPDASPFVGPKHTFDRPVFDASPAAAASARRTGRTTGRTTGRSRSTEPLSSFRSDAAASTFRSSSALSFAGDDRARLPGLFPPRVKSSFEKLSDDLHAGGSFVPARGMPGFADSTQRYQTLQQSNGRTFMDEDGEDRTRQRRYRNKLSGRVAAEARIVAAYEAEEEEKQRQQERSIRRKARMVEQYEQSIAREEAARTKVIRKKELVHDGERLFRGGECIAGRKGNGAAGRQDSVFPFTRFTTADPATRGLDTDYIKHVAGEREAKHHVGLRSSAAVGPGRPVQFA